MRSENSTNYLVPYDERVAQKAKKIRCSRCGRSSFEGLTICPNCGRNLRAATSRWITRGIPWGLAVLLCLSIWLFSGRSPVEWVMDMSRYAAGFAVNLGAQIEPRVTNPETVLNQSQGILQPNVPLTENTSASFAIITPVSNEPLIAGSQDSTDQSTGEQRLIAQNTDNQAGRQPAADDIALAPTPTPSLLPSAVTEQAAATVPTIAPTLLPTIVPTATSPPKPTDTPVPESPYRVEQITLESPSPGAVLDCGRDNSASWTLPVSVSATDRYELNLGYVSNQTSDQYVVTWIAKQRFSSKKASWVLDPAYCKLSLDQFNNQWVWTMQVIDEDGNGVSEPSRASYFVWRKPS